MVFNNDCSDNEHTSEEMCNDSVRPRGRQSSFEAEFRLKGLRIRDTLRQGVYDYDMHRPIQV